MLEELAWLITPAANVRLTKRPESGFDRRDPVGIDLREAVDGGDELAHGRLDPVDRLEDALVLIR